MPRVEFQNKFYKADGYLFAPFSYHNLIRDHQESAPEQQQP